MWNMNMTVHNAEYEYDTVQNVQCEYDTVQKAKFE